MIEQDLQMTVPDGDVDAVLFTPFTSGDSPRPGVLFCTDIGGIRDTMRQMARRLAAEGYTVLMPNLFYRTSRPPVFSFPRKPGDPATMKRMGELIAPLSAKGLERDLAAYLDTLTTHPATAKGKTGAVGFCIGGGIALRAAAVRPEHVAAVASFHGGGLYEAGDPESPHLVLPRVKARLYFGHATDDKSMEAQAIENFNKTLKEWGGKFESEVYEGARHGWTVPDNPAYNQPQAERAYAKLTDLFRETLT
ncbi:MAG TPA: dienelactone hydrolase family protein [Edaphobacter sp.]|nr:dienelactone hydrolase family protein [Edaphobacter sp.]